MDGLDEVKALIQERGAAFQSMFRAMETKSKAADETIAKLQSELKAVNSRADNLEVVLSRPGMMNSGNYTQPKPLEVKAFEKFVRQGERGLDDMEAKALLVGSDPDGGYLAPPTYSTELLRLITGASPIRRISRQTTISGAEIIFPKQLTKITAHWLGEISLTPESAPTFGQARIVPHRCSAYVETSQQLLEDSFINVDEELSREFAEEFASAEGLAFTVGNGIHKPRGILTYPAGTGTDQIEQVKTGAATTLTADCMITALYKLSEGSRNNATWLMNGSTLSEVRKMKDAMGRYLWSAGAQGLVAGQPETILGRPVVECADMPDVAAGTLPIVVGDFREGYRIIDRVQMSLIRDPFTKARSAIVAFTATRRVGGDVVRHSAFKIILVGA
jgi:HK97 family phage major capsid protein